MRGANALTREKKIHNPDASKIKIMRALRSSVRAVAKVAWAARRGLATSGAKRGAVKGAAPFNFGPASSRDSILHGSSKPGHGSSGSAIKQDDMTPWVEFVKSRGVTRVLSLLADDEIEEFYADDVEARMRSEFCGADGSTTRYRRVPNARELSGQVAIAQAVRDAFEADEKIVVHCSGGGGRCGLGLAVALVSEYGISREVAANEVVDYAVEIGVSRRVDASKLSDALLDALQRSNE